MSIMRAWTAKGGTLAYFLGNEHGKIHIREAADYDITSYKTAFVCATAAALALDIDARGN